MRRGRNEVVATLLPNLPGIRRRVKLLDLGTVEEHGGIILLWMRRSDLRLVRSLEKIVREELGLAPRRPRAQKTGRGRRGRKPQNNGKRG